MQTEPSLLNPTLCPRNRILGGARIRALERVPILQEGRPRLLHSGFITRHSREMRRAEPSEVQARIHPLPEHGEANHPLSPSSSGTSRSLEPRHIHSVAVDCRSVS
jgi:hypothetical protein